MIEKLRRSAQLREAAIAGQLETVVCRDKATHEDVEVLCLRIDGGLRPIARFYPDVDYANADVTVAEGHNAGKLKLLH
jgi:hypothetical protein